MTITMDEFRELTKDVNGDAKIIINFDSDLGSGTDFATNVMKCQGNVMIYC